MSLKWIVFYWSWNLEVSYAVCGYFDNRPRINLWLVFFHLGFILPIFNKWDYECDPPKWGIQVHHNTLWIHMGGKWNMKWGSKYLVWHIPFFTMQWTRRSILLKDGTWEHETQKDNKYFYWEEWNDKKKYWSYTFTDRHDGQRIPTILYVEEMEWRPKWLTWTKLFATVRRYIEVSFSEECGKKKWSWKGGVVGCSHELLEWEDPIDCIKRMEAERTF